jgi:hypothetical protein
VRRFEEALVRKLNQDSETKLHLLMPATQHGHIRKPFLGHTNLGKFIRNANVWKHMPTSGIGTVFNLPSSDMLRDHYLQLKPRNAGTYSRAGSILAMLIQFETFTCTRKTSGATTGLKSAGAPCRYGLFSLLKIPILRIHMRALQKKISRIELPIDLQEEILPQQN